MKSKKQQKDSTVFSDPAVAAMINPQVFAMLSNTDSLGFKSFGYKISELKNAAATIGAFDASDQNILFREGVVSFKGLAIILNRIGNFYAGYGPYDQHSWEDFFQSCANITRGKNWSEAAATNIGKTSCGEKFKSLLTNYRTKVKDNNYVFNKNRSDDDVGQHLPAILASSVIIGENSKSAFFAARKKYRNDESFQFEMDFKDVKFGYFVNIKDQSKLQAYVDGSSDNKLSKFLILNKSSQLKWGKALQISPMEPGLSPLLWAEEHPHLFPEGSSNIAYAGGWSDLAPVQVLKGIGCEETIYITRQGFESDFLTKSRPITEATAVHGVAEIMGLKQSNKEAQFEWNQPNSGFRSAVNQADAVWCTDWNLAGNNAFEFMFNHTYDIGNKDTIHGTGNRTGFVANSTYMKTKFLNRRLTKSTVGCL